MSVSAPDTARLSIPTTLYGVHQMLPMMTTELVDDTGWAGIHTPARR